MNEEKSVLVVEDDPFYSNIYKIKFEKAGLAAQVVGSGQAALDYSREHQPTLVLMDVIMPGKDGFETLREFKADAKLKDIKIIMLSNLSQEEDMVMAKKIGAADYIVKANTPIEEVVKLVKEHLG